MIYKITFQYDTTEHERRTNIKQYHNQVIYTSAPAQDWTLVLNNFCEHKHRKDLASKIISNIIIHLVERKQGDIIHAVR